MLKPSDINYLDDEVIKAYAASARAAAANSLGYLEV